MLMVVDTLKELARVPEVESDNSDESDNVLLNELLRDSIPLVEL